MSRVEPDPIGVYLLLSRQGNIDVTFKSNRENAELAQAAANSATLKNVRIREQRSAEAYAALATRDERIAAKAAALIAPSDTKDGSVEE